MPVVERNLLTQSARCMNKQAWRFRYSYVRVRRSAPAYSCRFLEENKKTGTTGPASPCGRPTMHNRLRQQQAKLQATIKSESLRPKAKKNLTLFHNVDQPQVWELFPWGPL